MSCWSRWDTLQDCITQWMGDIHGWQGVRMRHETVWTQHWKEHITDTVAEALTIKEESACKHPRNLLERSFNPPKPWLREVTASPAELSWHGEHSASNAEGKRNKNVCSPLSCPVTTSLGCTVCVHCTSSACWSCPNISHGHTRHTPRLQGAPSSCTGQVTGHGTSPCPSGYDDECFKGWPQGGLLPSPSLSCSVGTGKRWSCLVALDPKSRYFTLLKQFPVLPTSLQWGGWQP